ncbi:MAG: hypothetical protein LBG58_04795, partial [Planctomycetaceae bacterium]|nr:hypothetical protein [Planctomycetaceae bacterium]
CRRKTGASRLSPTQPWVKTLRRKVAYLLNQTKTTNIMPFAVYQWNFSEIEVYFLPPCPSEGGESLPTVGGARVALGGND